MLMTAAPLPAMERARGTVRLSVQDRAGSTRLRTLYQAGCLKAMLPRVHGKAPDAVLINTAGGLTGGDRLDIEIEAEAGTWLTVATQTAERAYRSAGGAAQIATRLRVGAGARLDWLAQETILFEGASLERSIEVELAADATVLMVEPIVLGRLAMGEAPDRARLRDRWQIRREGRLIHAEALDLVPPLAALRTCPAGLDGAVAMATAIYLGAGAEDWLEPSRRAALPEGVTGAISAWSGRLVARYLGPEPRAIRAALIELMTRLRGAPPPRVWTM